MKENELEKLRLKIDDVDSEILNLLAKRSDIVSEIGEHKLEKSAVVDLNREEMILNRLLNKTKANYSNDTLIRIWRELFEASSKLQISKNSSIETKRSISGIKPYKGGQSSLKGNSKIIKLSSNENSHGSSPKILQKLEINKITNLVHRYPEIDGLSIRNKIGKLNNINPDQIVLGCGSDEVLLFAALAFCKDGDEIIQAEHGFEMYPIIAKIVGAVTRFAKEDSQYKVSIKSICDQVTDSTKLIYLANPNNPTGNYLTRHELIELMNSIPKNVITVIDGAYAEYVMENNFDKDFTLVDRFENIILSRTFSKAYGLAGLRIGWCYTGKRVAEILNKVKGPFNTTFLSQQIALAALDDQNYISEVVNKNNTVKNWFEKELNKINIKTLPSFANFSFLKTTANHAIQISNHLQKDGIIIRQLDSYNLPHCLRITIGTEEEMQLTIKSLKKL